MLYRARHRRHTIGGCLMRFAMLLLLIALLAYPFLEPFMLETEARSITSGDLPAGVGQLRIVYLTDIHAGPFFSQSRVEDLIRTVNRLNADVVLLGGDYAEDSEGAIAFFRQLPPIRANYGVFAVAGNHDRTAPESNLGKLRSAMLSAGVTPLINDVAGVRIGTGTVYIAGIDDPDNGHPALAEVASRVRREDYVIFLAHSPSVIGDAHKATDANGRTGWFDLGLFGHTHGGQVALIGEWLGIAKVDARHQRGWITENRIDMLISHGVGTSVLPVRVLCRPQIHVITVNSAR